MKCIKCGYENAEGARFCSSCGEKIDNLICCSNSECDNYNQYIIPIGAFFCPKCGRKIELTGIPFHKRHLEMNLLSASEYISKYNCYLPIAKDIFIHEYYPEYIEDPRISSSDDDDHKDVYMVWKEKIGIARFGYKNYFWGKMKPYCQTVIFCKYDSIEKNQDGFVCHRDDKIYYFDLQGVELK